MVVVDASCLFEVVADTPRAGEIATRPGSDTDQVAPHVIDVEVMGVIRAQHLRGRMDSTAPPKPSPIYGTGPANDSGIAGCWSEHGNCAPRFADGTRSTWHWRRRSTRRCSRWTLGSPVRTGRIAGSRSSIPRGPRPRARLGHPSHGSGVEFDGQRCRAADSRDGLPRDGSAAARVRHQPGHSYQRFGEFDSGQMRTQARPGSSAHHRRRSASAPAPAG